MSDEKDDNDKFLGVKFKEKRFTTKSGEVRFETSAEAVLRHDDPKENPRGSDAGASADRATRKAKGEPAFDATHAQPMAQGAPPHEQRNVEPFSTVMNRREILKHENETEALRAEGSDVYSKVTFIHKGDAEGNKEKIPIAIRYEREDLAKGQKTDVTFGNFSSHKRRLFEEQEEGKKPSRQEVRSAEAKDNANYDRNRDRAPDPVAQMQWRNMNRQERSERLIKNDAPSSPPPRPSGPESPSSPPSRSQLPAGDETKPKVPSPPSK